MTDLVASDSVWDLVKLGIIGFLALYIVFAFVVLRQTHHMIETLKVGIETPIRLISILHLLFALVVLVISVVIL